MRIARVLTAVGPRFVELTDGGADTAVLLDGDVVGGRARRTRQEVPLASARLLVPTTPSKIVAVGRNYADHAAELGLAQSESPRIFFKPPSSLLAAGGLIEYPEASREVHHEAELAVVIGSECRAVTAEEARGAVFGFTCANDVTARDVQRRDGQPSWAKAFDTFCPLGPWVETSLDPSDVEVACAVNGTVRQRGRTSEMIYGVWELVAYVSSAMTLVPGDVLLTGTPAGVGALVVGDTVTVAIEGIGELTNPVGRGGEGR